MARRTRHGGAQGRHMGMRDGRRFGRSGRTAHGNMPSCATGSWLVGHRNETMTIHNHEFDKFRTKAATIPHELDVVNTRSAGFHETKRNIKKLRAMVDTRVCTGCGICQDVCPVAAISIDTVAQVDQMKCTGCGLCTTECPQGALTLHEM